jgi:S1-C subfamily serine protease
MCPQAPTPWRSLGATLEPISIAAARQLGLDDTTLAAHATPQPPVPPPTSGTRSNDEAAAEAAAPGENGEEGEEGEASVLMVTHVHHHHASGSGDSAPRGGSGGDSAALRGGDLLLSVDGVPIRSLYEAERATQRSESVALDVVRDGQVQTEYGLRDEAHANDNNQMGFPKGVNGVWLER